MGMCLPEIGGTVGQAFEHGKNELRGLGGVPLEQSIIASHNTAINGAMPIPPQIRQALTGYASEDSMNRVRYKIGDNGFLNLAHMLEQGGFASAVTLIDVVIFRGPSEASDLSIWAHELTHVDQYRDWGVHSFAVQYARDYNSVEAPAYAKGNGYSAWAQNHGVVQNQGSMGRFCVTNYARDMVQQYPLGSPCSNAVNPSYQYTRVPLDSWVGLRRVHNRGPKIPD
jgi:hypothetical protein